MFLERLWLSFLGYLGLIAFNKALYLNNRGLIVYNYHLLGLKIPRCQFADDIQIADAQF